MKRFRRCLPRRAPCASAHGPMQRLHWVLVCYLKERFKIMVVLPSLDRVRVASFVPKNDFLSFATSTIRWYNIYSEMCGARWRKEIGVL